MPPKYYYDPPTEKDTKRIRTASRQIVIGHLASRPKAPIRKETCEFVLNRCLPQHRDARIFLLTRCVTIAKTQLYIKVKEPCFVVEFMQECAAQKRVEVVSFHTKLESRGIHRLRY